MIEEQDREPVEEVGRRDLVLEDLRVAARLEARRQEPAGDVRQVIAEAGLVDRVDPQGAVRQVPARDVVAVPRDLGQDLAESERDDRQVVAAKPQRREADQDPEERGHGSGDDEHEEDREVDAAGADREADPSEGDVQLRNELGGAVVDREMGIAALLALELTRREPAHDVRPDRVEGDVAEVEQARVADDDVQSDGHHHENHHVSAGARGHVRERAEDRDLEEPGRDERIDERDEHAAEWDRPAARACRDPGERERDDDHQRDSAGRRSGKPPDQEDRRHDQLDHEPPRERAHLPEPQRGEDQRDRITEPGIDDPEQGGHQRPRRPA